MLLGTGAYSFPCNDSTTKLLNYYNNLMLLAIIDERDDAILQHPAIQGNAALRSLSALDADVIGCFSKAIIDLIFLPGFGDMRFDLQAFTRTLDAEQYFGAKTIHPAGGAGVPRPAAAPEIRRNAVHVCGNDVRLH